MLADMVVPCNASFNTAWERWLGTPVPRMMPLLNALEIDRYPCLQVGARSLHICGVGMCVCVYARCSTPRGFSML
jgi:hypothetical protein